MKYKDTINYYKTLTSNVKFSLILSNVGVVFGCRITMTSGYVLCYLFVCCV